MNSAPFHSATIAAQEFTDGLGVRTVIAARGTELLELLRVRPEFVTVPAFEFALRERVGRLANFRHAYYARVRRVDRLDANGLGIVSEHPTGARLSHVLEIAERHSLDLDVNAALCLIRQLVPAIAMLHHNARDVAHGVLGPERILVTPQARIVVIDYVLGSAVEQLRLSRERLWRDLQIMVPPGAGHPRLDHRADVMQIGAVSLALILGRRLGPDDPRSLSELLASATETTVLGDREPISPPLRRWLARALQLDSRGSFESAEDAQRGLDDVLSEEGGYVAAPVALEAFLACYREHAALTTEPPADPREAGPSAVLHFQPERPVDNYAPPPAVPPVHVVYTPERSAVNEPSAPVSEVTAPVAEVPSGVADFAPEPNVEGGFLASVPAASADVPAVTRTVGERSGRGRLQRLALVAVTLVAIGEGVFIWMTRAGASALPSSWGVLAIDSHPAGAVVVVDGRERGTTPTELKLPEGAHIVELRTGGEPRVLPVTIKAGVTHSHYIEMPAGATSETATLQIQGETGARVLVDGQLRGTAPLNVTDLAPGDHDVAVETPAGVRRQTVKLQAGMTASVDLQSALSAEPAVGWVAVTAPYEMHILEAGHVIGTTASRRLDLPPGRHTLEVVNETLAFRTSRTVDITAGKTVRLAIELPLGSISVNATPWAEVWIDGERVGDTPIGNLPVPIGPHEVVFKHPQFGERRHAVSVTLAAPARLSVNLKP
jgi:hypothetical protein